MRTHIDWITFTLTPRYQSEYPEGTTQSEVYSQAIEQAFLQTFDSDATEEYFGGVWEKQERSRAPYTDAWKVDKGGITVYASPTLNHLCVEISGQGCETLISAGGLEFILRRVEDRVTRIDIASDIRTSVRPTEFVQRLSHERMRASGYQSSESGETCYIGSQKSDRYARVYRYHPPHPRADLLRVEHVFRKDYAKKVAAECAAGHLEGVAISAGRAMGWTHEVWQPASRDPVDISVVHGGRVAGNTVRWLITSGASAFQRLCKDGTIENPEAFLREYFLTGL